jgi:hypothetical protein
MMHAPDRFFSSAKDAWSSVSIWLEQSPALRDTIGSVAQFRRVSPYVCSRARLIDCSRYESEYCRVGNDMDIETCRRCADQDLDVSGRAKCR